MCRRLCHVISNNFGMIRVNFFYIDVVTIQEVFDLILDVIYHTSHFYVLINFTFQWITLRYMCVTLFFQLMIPNMFVESTSKRHWYYFFFRLVSSLIRSVFSEDDKKKKNIILLHCCFFYQIRVHVAVIIITIVFRGFFLLEILSGSENLKIRCNICFFH